jgi:hypothetical protein
VSVATRRALYGKLAGDGTLTAMLGTPAPGYSQSIYYQVAPQAASFAYVVLLKSSSVPRYTLGARAYDNDIWTIKGVGRDTGTNATADPVDNIASRLDALLTDGAISISGRTQLYLRRESDLDYPEVIDGVTYRHAGCLFRLLYQ